MYLSAPIELLHPHERRQRPRRDIQCRARIRIGNRQYAGYIQNISRGGAQLRTITPIRRLGQVILRLPDMPPIRCGLRWSGPYNAGVAFETELSPQEFATWTRGRSGGTLRPLDWTCDSAELEFVE
jgi:hypothetical protein